MYGITSGGMSLGVGRIGSNGLGITGGTNGNVGSFGNRSLNLVKRKYPPISIAPGMIKSSSSFFFNLTPP